MAKFDRKIEPEFVGVKGLDTAAVSAEFPQLRLPTEEIADSGIVRLGNGFISADFPVNSPRRRRSSRS